MKVIGYVRVSTEEQAREGFSLAAQEEKLRAYASLYDLELVAIVHDAGASAKSLQRAGLREALGALDTGQAEGLLVARLDRLTRSVRDLGTLLDSHFAGRFALMSVAEQLDTTTAAGRLVLNILICVAQWERETIAERTATALAHKRAQGGHLGPPRLGMDLIDGQLRENQDEQASVARMLELRGQNMTLREIAHQMTAEGRQTKRGGDWHPQTIARALKWTEGADG